jgi:gas vesicle protein
MSKKGGFGKFLTGVIMGVGLGFLFAPKKGSETRKDLMNKINELIAKVKDIDIAEVKSDLESKLEDIKTELEDLDKEKVLKIARRKAADLKSKSEELLAVAVKKGTPIVQQAAEDVKEKIIAASKEIIEKLEKKDEKKEEK